MRFLAFVGAAVLFFVSFGFVVVATDGVSGYAMAAGTKWYVEPIHNSLVFFGGIIWLKIVDKIMPD